MNAPNPDPMHNQQDIDEEVWKLTDHIINAFEESCPKTWRRPEQFCVSKDTLQLTKERQNSEETAQLFAGTLKNVHKVQTDANFDKDFRKQVEDWL